MANIEQIAIEEAISNSHVAISICTDEDVNENPDSRKDTPSFRLIYLASSIFFLAQGLLSVAATLLINQRLAGNAEEPNSISAFTDLTSSFLYGVASKFQFHNLL